MKNIIVILVFAFAACSAPSQKENSASELKVNETLEVTAFHTKLNESPGAVLVDVRTPEEFANGNIEGAINIDFKGSDFEQKIAELDKGKTYLVYCLSGGRSGKAATRMNALGFTSLYTLNGGYTAWIENQNK
jgi:rhodanese-related sulfurtransferase